MPQLLNYATIALVIGFAIIALKSVDACRCLPDKMASPRFCRTPYLGLLKVTRTEMDAENLRKHYYFELIQDLTDFGETHRLSLKSFSFIDDPMAMTSCQTNLEVNQVYLIGLQEDGSLRHQPVFTPCTSLVQAWPHTGAESDAKIADMKKYCGQKSN